MPKTHTTPHHKHHPILILLALTLLAAQSIITINNPYGIGPLTHATTLTIAFLTIAIAPFTHAYMPLRIWGFVPLGILFLGSARIIDLQWPRTDGNPHVDILFTLGYLSFGIWFAQLNNQAGKVLTYRAVLDAIAVTTSVILLLWTIPALRTSLDNPLLVLQWTAYPVLDATIVVLTGHIAYRIGTYIHAWYWVCASMTVQLAADLTWAQYGLDAGLTNHTLPSALTATGYGLLAIACAHPSVVTMRDLTMPPQPLSPHPWRHVLLYLPLIPAVIYISLPTTDRIDTTVRVTLTLLLLILLYLRLIGTTNDLSRAENESQHRAQHDSLTGLLNRSALFEVLEQRLNRDNNHHHSTALLFFDCDHFKEVNDTWGHATGDRLLTNISTGLPRQLRADDVIARIGGDEFVIVATVTSPTDAHQLA
ncbi:GGDEF domain-containing protein, partial [Dermatophilus congolensis]